MAGNLTSSGKPSKPKKVSGPVKGLRYIDHGERDKKGHKLVEARQKSYAVPRGGKASPPKKKPPVIAPSGRGMRAV